MRSRLLSALVIMLLWATPAISQTNDEERPIATSTKWLMGGLVITGGIDTNLTTYIRAKCGEVYREANPIVRPIVDSPALLASAKGIITALGAYAIYRMAKSTDKWTRRLAVWSGIGLTALNSYAIGRNYQFYRETLDGCPR